MKKNAVKKLQLSRETLGALKSSDVKKIGSETTRNFFGPLQQIIPWASNYYTETLIRKTRERFGADFWGFWMLGGMSGAAWDSSSRRRKKRRRSSSSSRR